MNKYYKGLINSAFRLNQPNSHYFLTNLNKYTLFNSNKNTNSQQQHKGQGRKQQKSSNLQTNLQNVQLPFPFEFSLQANNYKYYDPRFTQYPIKKNLQTPQKQHLIHVLQNFQNYLNSTNMIASQRKTYVMESIKNYVHPLLSNKIQKFTSQNKESDISIKFQINKQSITKTQGYMEIQAQKIQQASSLNFMKLKYIHQYSFQREKQLLLVAQKKNKAKKSQQQLLKQDVKQMMDQKSKKKEMRQFLQEMQKQKANDSQRAVNFLMSKLKSLANKKPVQKKREQQSFLTSQLIKGKVKCSVIYKNQLISQEQTDLYTKWMYLVQKYQPQSIRKSRKRILYDFQFWNRGTFFEVKDWISDLTK